MRRVGGGARPPLRHAGEGAGGGARSRARRAARYRHPRRPAAAPAVPGGRVGLRHGAVDEGARGAAQGAQQRRARRDRPPAHPGARGDLGLAAIRVSHHQSRRKGGRGPARHRHPGGALAHEPADSQISRRGGPRVMAFPSLEQSLDKVSNRYLLVVLAAKRARQLNRGAAAQVETKLKKPTSTALEEIAEAKIGYRVREEDTPKE